MNDIDAATCMLIGWLPAVEGGSWHILGFFGSSTKAVEVWETTLKRFYPTYRVIGCHIFRGEGEP